MIFVGIDSGGSTLRAAVTDSEMNVLAEVTHSETANPAVIGYDAVAGQVDAIVIEALHQVGVQRDEVCAIGLGIAGAAVDHAPDWLKAVGESVLPGALTVPCSDYEIALVGAHGRRQGVLILAGTGSVAYAVDESGRVAEAGGWGYLFGDPGSGYWLGMEGLRAVSAAADGNGPKTSLSETLLSALNVETARAIIPRVYAKPQPPIREIASLAPLVLDAAQAGDRVSCDIVSAGVDVLAGIVEAVIRRLSMDAPRIGFAGGLLLAENPLSRGLCARLDLPDRPHPLYTPVVGAALLARDVYCSTL